MRPPKVKSGLLTFESEKTGLLTLGGVIIEGIIEGSKGSLKVGVEVWSVEC